MARKRHSRVKHYLLPHKGNNYKPQIFAVSSIAVILAALIVLQGFYFFTTHIVFKQSNFLASVLPGALIAMTNQDREEQNLGALTEDPELARAAQMKADDMAAKGYFAHVTPEGYQPWHWLDLIGYKYSYAGENLAVNFTDSKDVETAWMNSPTHRANIVKPEYTRVGIATAQGMYKGEEVTFVVQVFATPPEAVSAEPEPAVTKEESAPTQTPVAQETPAADEASAQGPVQDQVLGAETAPEAVNLAKEAATSPTHTLIYILAGLAIAVLILVLIAFMVHLNIQYVEALGGGLALLLIVLAFLVFNTSQISLPEVPAESQSAAVVNAF